MKLNLRLVQSQKLTKKDIALVQKMHKKRKKLFKMIRYDMKKGDYQKLLDSVEKLRQIEFKLQDAWKFERRENMHSWWFQNPACTCPKLDNLDNIGTDRRNISGTCLIHNVEVIKEL